MGHALHKTGVYLMGLIISCPHGEAEEDCPLSSFRQEPITKLIEVTNRFSIEKQIAITKHHKRCLRTKTAACLKVS